MRLAEQQNMRPFGSRSRDQRSEEHTSELQSRFDLVCRLLLEKKKHYNQQHLKNLQVNKRTSHHYHRVREIKHHYWFIRISFQQLANGHDMLPLGTLITHIMR